MAKKETAQEQGSQDGSEQPPGCITRRNVLALSAALVGIPAALFAARIALQQAVTTPPQPGPSLSEHEKRFFKIEGTPEFQAEVKRILPIVFERLRKLNIPLPGFSKAIPMVEGHNASQIARTHFPNISIHPSEIEKVAARKISRLPCKPMHAEKVELEISHHPDHDHPEVALLHEIFHVATGDIPLPVWREGMAEALEKIAFPDHTNARGQVLRHLHLEQFPWNYRSIEGLLLPREDHLQKLAAIAAAPVWLEYLKKNPEFLSRFVKACQSRLGVPQTWIPSETELDFIASSIDQKFPQEMLFPHPIFRKPYKGLKLRSYFRYKEASGKAKLILFWNIWDMQVEDCIDGTKRHMLILKSDIPPAIQLRYKVGEQEYFREEKKLKVRERDYTVSVPLNTTGNGVDIFDPDATQWITVREEEL